MTDFADVLAKRFKPLAVDTSPGTVIELWGGPGTGKTDLAMRAPGPVIHFAFDYHGHNRPAARIKEKYPNAIIFPKVYPMKPRDRKNEPNDAAQRAMKAEVIDPFLSDYEYAVGNGARSIIIDTFDMMKEAQVIARFGKVEANPMLEYQDINSETSRLIHLAREAQIVLILIERVKEEYVPVPGKKFDQATGKFIPASNVRTAHSVDSRLETFTEKNKFFVRVVDAKQNKEMNGKELESPEFPELAFLLKPQVDPSAWE